MRRSSAIAALMAIAAAAWPVAAAAAPVSGPHETVDNQFTTVEPNAPTGFRYSASYHAAGDPTADPPYMRRMASYFPAGMRYDTSVPERCTASDLQLQLEGPSACPDGSRLGGGTARGKFMGSESTLDVDLFNNEGGQVMVVHSPLVVTVARGRFAPDGSIEFASPTCYPALVTCPADNALQMGSNVTTDPYTRGGRSYSTTPPSCPKAGYWRTPIRFWWADGSDETVVTTQPCARHVLKKKPRRGSRRR